MSQTRIEGKKKGKNLGEQIKGEIWGGEKKEYMRTK
jgi:hypothetical protein